MTAPQRAIFQSLLDEYCQNMTDQIDQTREDQIKKAGDNIYFAWAGGEEPGQGHYYRDPSRPAFCWSSTTRKTTPIIFTRFGATLMAISARTC